MQVREYTAQGATFRIQDAHTLGAEIDSVKMHNAAVFVDGALEGVMRDLFTVVMTCVTYTHKIEFAPDAELTDATRSIRDVWTSEAFKARDFIGMWHELRNLESEARDLWFEAWQRTRPTHTAPDELTPEAEAAAKAGAGDADFLADGKPKESGTSKPSAGTKKR